jgi:hypothetical protein
MVKGPDKCATGGRPTAAGVEGAALFLLTILNVFRVSAGLRHVRLQAARKSADGGGDQAPALGMRPKSSWMRSMSFSSRIGPCWTSMKTSRSLPGFVTRWMAPHGMCTCSPVR